MTSSDTAQAIPPASRALSIEHVDVLFGPKRQHGHALQLLDKGQGRDQILEQTGVVLGVADACLEVPQGSISVLMGLSGSGKSSLLRCVNGLNAITRGSLLVETKHGPVNVASCDKRALRRLRRASLAMVFQQFGLLPWATVRENIAFGLSVRGEARQLIEERVQEQLELVGLTDWADKPIQTLSGGMQQRVGLARAFATDADILLMDEPFSALDPLIREHLQDELLILQQRLKKTILFVSHDLDEALKLGNRISIMEAGRIVQTGTIDDIVFRPADDYVRRFAASINPLSVLTARTVMQPMAFDRNTGIARIANEVDVKVENGKVIQCELRGKSVAVMLCKTDDDLAACTNRVACVHESLSVKQLLVRAASSSLCTLVLNGDGEPCGVVDAQDVCKALAEAD